MIQFPGFSPRSRFLLPALLSVWLAASLTPVFASEIIRTGRVEVHGNDRIQSYVILRAVPLAPGDPFDYGKLEEGRRNVRLIPGVDYSEIRVNWQPEDSAMALHIMVTEKRAFSGNVWLERGYENEISIGARALEENFRGRSERLEAYFVVIGNTILGLSWENPWIGSGRRIGLGLDGYYKSYRYVYDDFDDAYSGAEVTRWGGRVSPFYMFSTRSRVFVELGYETIDGDREGVTIDPGGDSFPIVALGVRWDRRDGIRFPWSGSYLEVVSRALGPFQDLYSINEGTVDARIFAPLFGRTVLGAHIAYATRTGNNIPIYRREHLGGGNTIRGWDYGAFNGDNSLVGGVEYRLPLNFTRERPLENVLLGVEFHVFADAGAAWQSSDELSGDILHGGGGFGLALLNRQVRGLRFDYGWRRKSSGRFHFEVGLKF